MFSNEFSSVQVNSDDKPSPNWQPTGILNRFDQQPPPGAEQGFLVSCQIDYNDLSLGTELGHGSFGIVYKAIYHHASVAIKRLQIGNLSSEAQEEFRKEAEMMAQLRHPNIVHFYGYCSIPKCLVMEYMPKGSLFKNLFKIFYSVLILGIRNFRRNPRCVNHIPAILLASSFQ